MATKIVVYTKNNCGDCKRAKFMFEACPIDVGLIEKNVDESEVFMDELNILYSSYTLPTFVFEDGEVIRGFHEGKIMNKLGL
ncbi:TPA: glutaredoxin family protein [Bacillus mobilis]|nr:glutaredoxin family protein [Bacillus mobilis]